MIRNTMILAALALALASASPWLYAKEDIAQFSGDSSQNTADFEVDAPWIVDWTISGDPGQYEAVTISLIDANTGAYEGSVLRAKEAGNGVIKFNQSGQFYFRVDASMMHWSLRVIKLTEKEAEQYKPRQKPSEMYP